MNKYQGFTMAEILLSLTIIGVVAAITLPSLTGNINERTWNTQRKALYARMSQAISIMPALNGYGMLDDTTDTATETFITNGLAKVLKINNICNATHITDCGIVEKFNTFNAGSLNTPTTLYDFNETFSHIEANNSPAYETANTNAAAFETQNGESIIAYYNRSCTAEYLSNSTPNITNSTFGYPQSAMCVNFIYDLNGKKGPNTVGKDIGYITVFNATDSTVVMPILSSTTNAKFNNSDVTWDNASKACTQQDPESRIPNIDEASSLLLNKSLTGLSSNNPLWTSTPLASEPGQAWQISVPNNIRQTEWKYHNRSVRCIKR